MKLILKQEVDNVGLAGDVVDVADGYGRNFLLPRGMALPATRGAMREAQALTRSRRAVEAETLDSALAVKEILEGRTLQVTARVDERGHLYGSVGVNDVHRVLRERGHQIERKRIDLKGSIKQIGSYEVPVQVHPQVEALVTVEVLDEEGQVIFGEITEPEIPPLLGEAGKDQSAEDQPAASSEPAPEAEPAAEPAVGEDTEIDSVEALVEQALEAADEYESSHAAADDQDEPAADDHGAADDDTGRS